MEECLREALLFVQAVHSAHVLRTHDSLVGFLGCCTGLYDVRELWRGQRAGQTERARIEGRES